jgi:hypothetical protein
MSYLLGGCVQLGHIVPNFNAAIYRWLARGLLIWKNISAPTHCSRGRLCRQILPPLLWTVATNRSNCGYSTMSSQLSTANTCCRTRGVAYIIWSSG